MTTTITDNNNGDQDDNEQDDLTGHPPQSHLGTENSESHITFHKNRFHWFQFRSWVNLKPSLIFLVFFLFLVLPCNHIPRRVRCFFPISFPRVLSGAKRSTRKNPVRRTSGAPKTPPPGNSSCRPCSCILKEKEAPKHQELRSQGSPGRGFWEGGFLAKCFLFMRWHYLRHSSESLS